MPTIYPLLGDRYEITEEEDARIRKENRAEFEQARKCREAEAAEAKEVADADSAYRAELDSIDKALFPHLSKEHEKENSRTRPRAAHKADFKAFQKCCERWGLPALPAPPQAVAVHLAEESEHGAAHLARLARSISVIHLACNFSDPTIDILVRALLRLARTEKPNSPQKKD